MHGPAVRLQRALGCKQRLAPQRLLALFSAGHWPYGASRAATSLRACSFDDGCTVVRAIKPAWTSAGSTARKSRRSSSRASYRAAPMHPQQLEQAPARREPPLGMGKNRCERALSDPGLFSELCEFCEFGTPVQDCLALPRHPRHLVAPVPLPRSAPLSPVRCLLRT